MKRFEQRGPQLVPRDRHYWEGMMLTDFAFNPVLPAQDGARARRFYRDILGLELLSGPHDDPMMFRSAAGSTLVVTEIPERIPPSYPLVSFQVTGIAQLVAALKARGCHFQALPASASFAGQQATRQGEIMDFGPIKSAFLLDSEGNVLALNEIIG